MPDMTVGEKPRIFQIEDNEDLALYVKVMLERAFRGQVTYFTDGLKGLQACLSEIPDLIILDLELPSLHGEEICRMLKSSRFHKHIPIVVCSMLPEPERHEYEMLQIGADAYMPKPFDEHKLIKIAGSLLMQRRVSFAAPVQEPVESLASPVSRNSLPSSIDELPPKPAKRPEPHENEEFAGYRIIELLGSGGMGTVYKAVNTRLSRPVALKVMLSKLMENERLVERFRREGRIMGALNHPNIVQIYDIGETDYTLFIAMEYIDGGSLHDRLERGRIPWKECHSYIRQMFDAVAYMHSKGVIHRDIKPSNFLLTHHGVLKVTDFGVSRRGGPFEKQEFTRLGAVIGTPRYMAPEVLAGSTADELSDQFALGRTILHLLEGPVMSFPPKPLHDIRPDLPLPLSKALARCMDVHPSMRFPVLEEARKAVLRACDDFGN